MSLTAKRRRSAMLVLSCLMVTAAFLAGYFLASTRKAPSEPSTPVAGTDASDESGTAYVTWTCSMHPQIRLPEPGKCPICFMDLIPLKEEGRGEESGRVSLRQITLSSEAVRLAEVVTEPAVRRPVGVETRLVGKVDYDETRLGYITSWVAGRIDELFVSYTGSSVSKGQAMASIYSPELLTAQAELIQAVSTIKEIEKSDLTRVREAAAQTEKAAREKLRLLGLTPDQIEGVIRSETPSDHVLLHAPMSGIVIRKDVLEGQYVQTGTRIYTIADLSRVWVVLEAYESDLPWIRRGQMVEFQTEAYPGETFRGKTVYVDPMVNEKTRTVRVRLDVPNPSGRLKPGMFVRALKRSRAEGVEAPLVIPASAPLITGKRAIVYVQIPERPGAYEGREIVLGPRAGDEYIVKSGLLEGDRVVTRGNFKIDSAVQLLARPSMMNPRAMPEPEVHHHGSSSDRPSTGEKGIIRIPASLAPAAARLQAEFRGLSAVVDTRDIQRIREGYRSLRKILQTMDAGPLSGEAALHWREVTMLLRNDALLGSEADTPEEGARLFLTFAEHFQGLTERFDFEQAAWDVALSESVSPLFRQQLGRVLRNYLQLHEALAADDLSKAKNHAESLADTLKSVESGLLKDAAHSYWMKVSMEMEEGLTMLSGAKDITGLRSGFAPLSASLIRAVDLLGVEIKGPLYELFCPMAFNDRGATWLQQDPEIRNPYYGSEMYRCGEVRRQVRGG